MIRKEAAPGRRNARVILIAAVAAHCLLNSYSIMRHFLGGMLDLTAFYYRMPPDRRFFVNSLEDSRAITAVRAVTPEAARIVWVPGISPIVNYHIYPRRIYQMREFLPGEEVKLDVAFLKSRHITHVFVDPDRIYPVRYDSEEALKKEK